jgi:predicted nucleic acid-binding Zn ribbon protein
MWDESLTMCPECGGSLRKVFAPPAISFKGSGFYTTDHGKKSKVSAESRSDGEKKMETKTSDGSTKSEGKKETSSKDSKGSSGGSEKSSKPAKKEPAPS